MTTTASAQHWLLRTRMLLEQDLLAGKATFDDFAFSLAKSGKIEQTDEGEDIVDQAL